MRKSCLQHAGRGKLPIAEPQRLPIRTDFGVKVDRTWLQHGNTGDQCDIADTRRRELAAVDGRERARVTAGRGEVEVPQRIEARYGIQRRTVDARDLP